MMSAKPKGLMRPRRNIRLKNAIDKFRSSPLDVFDPEDCTILDRLLDSIIAINAFEIFDVEDDDGAGIIYACVTATELKRTFKFKVESEQRMLVRLNEFDVYVRELDDFIKNETYIAGGTNDCSLAENQTDNLRHRIGLHPSTRLVISHGLAQIADTISTRRRTGQANIADKLGALRNLTGDAAVNAAIRHIAITVREVTGRQHLEPTADLAQAVLGGIITPDRVRKACKNRPTENPLLIKTGRFETK